MSELKPCPFCGGEAILCKSFSPDKVAIEAWNRRNRKMEKIIAVDFDGTLCENKYPEIGKPNLALIADLIMRKHNGDRVILWTCRSGRELVDAVRWCAEHKLIFDAVNENLPDVIEIFGSDTRKIFANEYIDDRNSTEFKLPFIKGEEEHE